MTNRITKYLLEEKHGSPFGTKFNEIVAAYEYLIALETDDWRKDGLMQLLVGLQEDFARGLIP